MSWLLERLLGRLPIGWLQLASRKGRFAAALVGVGFAVLLVLFQIGFIGALSLSVELPYRAIKADIILSGPDARTLKDGSTIPRQRVLDALALPDVEHASPVYLGTARYDVPVGRDVSLQVFGVETGSLSRYWPEEIARAERGLEVLHAALIDRGARGLPPGFFDGIGQGAPPIMALNDVRVGLVGTFEIGAGFDSDGYLIVSERTFFEMFPAQSPGAPTHVFVDIAEGADQAAVRDALSASWSPVEAKARLREEAAADEVRVQTVEAPTGIIFGFGAVMGMFVGVVIVFQVLSTEVSDHMREYATLKAVGYRGRYFSSIVLEEAVILGVGGFVPGALTATWLYGLVSGATGLPMVMTGERLAWILAGTLIACIVSGLLAARKLASADPADLY